jgi:hypothetical protein
MRIVNQHIGIAWAGLLPRDGRKVVTLVAAPIACFELRIAGGRTDSRLRVRVFIPPRIASTWIGEINWVAQRILVWVVGVGNCIVTLVSSPPVSRKDAGGEPVLMR